MSKEFDSIMKYDVANKLVYKRLCEEIKTETGVLPFVGAGISAFTYETWDILLTRLASDLPSDDEKSVIDIIKSGDYYKAADFLCEKYGDIIFYSVLREVFSEDKINDDILKETSAFLVPQICDGDCITTNYDRILEHACRLNNISPDKALPNDINQLNEYLRNGRKKSALVFKIHGDIMSNKDDIILTGKSYDKHYAVNAVLRKQLIKWIDSRKLLFLGTSLNQDKTVDIMRERMEEGMYNFAIYGCKQLEIPSLKEHFQKLNIIAIFYDSSDHGNLKTILQKLIHDTKK